MTTATLISLIVSGVMMVIAIATFFITITNNSKKSGETFAEIRTSLRDLISTVKEIKSDVKELIADMSDASTRIVVLENKFDRLEKDVEWLKSMVDD